MPAPLAANNRLASNALESPMPRLAVPAVMLSAFLLSGCGSGDLKFAPACPQLALLAEGSELTRFAGPGRDVTDRVLEARITGVDASCRGARSTDVVAYLKVQADVIRGPAARGRGAQVPYFVAVMQGDAVLDRRDFVLDANFPANVDSMQVAGGELELRFPAAGERGAAQYKIVVSLQLTEEELAYNRRAMRR
jgi:hypothetical protein